MVLNLCPTIRLFSFTMTIMIIDLVMFAVSLRLNGIVNTEFLAPNPEALSTLGWKDS